MKKKVNIILIIVVLALWGVLGYRFVSNYFYKAPDLTTADFGEGFDIDAIFVQRDTFALEKLERDAFLNKAVTSGPSFSAVKKTNAVPLSTSVVTTKKTSSQQRIWPQIEYYGFISSGKNELVLLKINGVFSKMYKGQSLDELTVRRIARDSVEIAFGKEVRVFGHN